MAYGTAMDKRCRHSSASVKNIFSIPPQYRHRTLHAAYGAAVSLRLGLAGRGEGGALEKSRILLGAAGSPVYGWKYLVPVNCLFAVPEEEVDYTQVIRRMPSVSGGRAGTHCEVGNSESLRREIFAAAPHYSGTVSIQVGFTNARFTLRNARALGGKFCRNVF